MQKTEDRRQKQKQISACQCSVVQSITRDRLATDHWRLTTSAKRHSYLSAVIGSTREARRAGTNPAPSAMTASRLADATNTAGS